MTKDQIRQTCAERMVHIEDRFTHYVPPEVQNYYLLMDLIANRLETYVEAHGLYPLDLQACIEGKELCGYGGLSFFERDCISFLNNLIAQEEARHASRRALSIAPSYRHTE